MLSSARKKTGTLFNALLLTLLLSLLQSSCQSPVVKSGEAAESDPELQEQLNSEIEESVAESSEEKEEEEQPEEEDSSLEEELERRRAIKESKPDKKGRRVKTYFYGRELVREQVEIDGYEQTRITIRGSAVLKHNSVKLAAPRIELDAGEYGRCRGGVKITDKPNGLQIFSDSADYLRGEQKVTLFGKPRMFVKRKDEQKPVVVTANRIERDLAENISYFEGDVRIIHENRTLLAPRAIYRDDLDQIELVDYPVLLSPGQYLSGKRMIYLPEEKTAFLENRVLFYSTGNKMALGISLDPEASQTPGLEEFARTGGHSYRSARRKNLEEPEKEAEDEPPSVSVLSAERMEYFFGGEEERFLELSDQVRLTSEDLDLSAPKLRLEGKEFETLYAREGVEMYEKNQRNNVVAGFMKFERETGHLLLEDEPRMEFRDRNNEDEINATLTGSVIERDAEDRKIYARGAVRIVRDNFEAQGEEAVYDERSRVIVMEGEPALREGNKVIKSGKVMIFPDEDRILLLNRIQGYVIEE